MAKELNYPVMNVNGRLMLNVAASLPRLMDTSSSVKGGGASSASSQTGSEGGSTHGDIVLSGGGDLTSKQQQFQQSMQQQLQQSMSTLGDKLMVEMGRQLAERLGEVNASMKQMSRDHTQLQERVLEQTTTTTDIFAKLKQQMEDYRRETKEAQEKGDKKIEEALRRMAETAKTIDGRQVTGGTGVGGSGVKDLAGTHAMDE
jgi:methyl-accepting chemotaxis protein